MKDEVHATGESPIACDMSAIDTGLRARHVATGAQLFRAAEEIRELPDGYAFRLPRRHAEAGRSEAEAFRGVAGWGRASASSPAGPRAATGRESASGRTL